MAKKRTRKCRTKSMKGRCMEITRKGVKRRICWGKNGKIKSNKVLCSSKKSKKRKR